jgi:acetyl esterase/lipase
MTGLAVDYRLAPEHRYPAAVDDAVTAYRWLLEKGYEPSRVAVAGDSAGGGLAMALLMRLRDEGHPLPAVGAFMSSWFDLQVTGASVERNEPFDYVSRASLRGFARHYLGATTEPGEPYASPLFGRFEGLPPMMLQAGEAEALLDDSVRVAERAKDAGVEVTLEVEDDMIHAYQAFAERFPVGQRAIDRLGAFIRGRVNLPVAASDGKAEAETDSPAGS